MIPRWMRFSRKTESSQSLIGFAVYGAVLGACVYSPLDAHAQNYPVTITDVTGAKIVLSAPPKRIVTLVPSLGELAADILEDQMNRIVGVSDYTDFPPVLKRRTSIGSYVRFNIESVVVLRPDVVLATTDGNPKDRVLQLREAGVPVVVVGTGSFDEIFKSILLVGRALGYPGRAERLLKQMFTFG